MMYFILGVIVGVYLGVFTMVLLRMADDDRCADADCERRV